MFIPLSYDSMLSLYRLDSVLFLTMRLRYIDSVLQLTDERQWLVVVIPSTLRLYRLRVFFFFRYLWCDFIHSVPFVGALVAAATSSLYSHSCVQYVGLCMLASSTAGRLQ